MIKKIIDFILEEYDRYRNRKVYVSYLIATKQITKEDAKTHKTIIRK